MATKTFDKNISKKIINEFCGDIFEHIESFIFKKVIDEAIEEILNNTFDHHDITDIYNLILTMKKLQKLIYGSVEYYVFFNINNLNNNKINKIIKKLSIKMKLIIYQKDSRIYFQDEILRKLNAY